MGDLTVIYLSASKTPKHFANRVRGQLLGAIGDLPLISVSREKINWGDRKVTEMFDTAENPSHLNMYRMLLEACKVATTDYIATAEDDTLYPPEHFTFFRPALDTIAYDMSRWSLFTWKPEYFSLKQRISNSTLIAPRLEYIDALTERLEQFKEDRPELISEVGRYETNLGIKPRKIQMVYCDEASVQINHEWGTDHLKKRKKLGQVKARVIPRWGCSCCIVENYVRSIDSNTSAE